jgi:hypothetical protein
MRQHDDRLQDLGFVSFPISLVKRINPSFSLVVYLSLSFFFLQGGSQAVSNKFDSLAFLKYVVQGGPRKSRPSQGQQHAIEDGQRWGGGEKC